MRSFPDNYLPADPAPLLNLGPTRSVGRPTPDEEVAGRYNVLPSTLEPRLLGTLFYLVSIGLVAAATVIIFGITSFSFFHTGIEVTGGSHISDVFSESHVVAAPPTRVPAETKLPTSAAKAPVRSTANGPTTDNDTRPSGAPRAPPASQPVPSGANEVSAAQDDALVD